MCACKRGRDCLTRGDNYIYGVCMFVFLRMRDSGTVIDGEILLVYSSLALCLQGHMHVLTSHTLFVVISLSLTQIKLSEGSVKLMLHFRPLPEDA